jgi:hypothetical protein
MAGMLASALGLYLTTDVTYEGQHMTLGELLMQEVGKAWGGTSDNPLIIVLARLRQLQRKGVIPKTSMDLSAV